MPQDGPHEPLPGPTYDGFSGQRPQPQPRGARPAVSRTWILAGVAIAIVLGLALGLWARPNFGGGKPTDTASATPSATPPSVPIEVGSAPPPGSLPRANGKLEVLPPDMAQAANARAPVAATALAPFAEGSAAPASAVAPPPVQAAPPLPPPQTYADRGARPSAPALRASFDCAAPHSLAEQMVCEDPGLAAADRELARAYRRALASGASPGQIRSEQRDWMSIREDAARHSPGALQSVYAQRIEELNAIADQGDPEADGPGAS